MRRAALAMIAAVVMVLALTGPTAAQSAPRPLTISDTIVDAGSVIELSASGWLPDSVATFMLLPGPVMLGSAKVGEDTSFAAQLQVPSSITPATYTLRVRGAGSHGEPRTEELTVKVLAQGAGGDAVILASTGSEVTVGLGLAAVLAAGSARLVVARRRRERVQAHEHAPEGAGVASTAEEPASATAK